MKTKIITNIQNEMKLFLNQIQYLKLTRALLNSLKDIEIISMNGEEFSPEENSKLLKLFLSAKQVEGRSKKKQLVIIILQFLKCSINLKKE